ncbi:MAG: hypothetical protein ACYC2G_07635 [Gemmatimonadaceae bacterium]
MSLAAARPKAARAAARPPERSPERSFTACATVFIVAAAALAVARAITPIDRGWWLVAYLSLVGGVAQLMLGPGLIALARLRNAPAPGGRRAMMTRLVLWNAGTLLVAAANLAGAMPGVVAGSALLLGALALFTGDLRTVRATANLSAPWWVRGYVVLLVFLALSVVVGTVLAYRST